MAMEHPDRFVMKPQREGGGKFITAQFALCFILFMPCMTDVFLMSYRYVCKLDSHPSLSHLFIVPIPVM